MVKTLKIRLFQQIVNEEHKSQKFTAKTDFQDDFTGKKIKTFCN